MAVTAETERVADVRRYRFTVDEFARMGEAGIFTAEDRVELLDGEIVAMTPIGALHAGLVSRLNELIVTCLAGNAYVGIQNPVRLDHHTEPQPDLVVARRRTSFYTDRHPEPGDIFLVIEVADSSLRYGRLEKVPRYGRAGIPETWLVDVEAVAVTVYTDPGAYGYANRQVRHRGDEIIATRAPEIRFSVDDVFAYLTSSTASEPQDRTDRRGLTHSKTGRPPALIGLDVGFSTSRTSGVARLGVDGELRLGSATSTWASRSVVVGTERADIAAIDAPYTTAKPDQIRSCEHVFTLGRFQRRCKPALSHVPGTGRELRDAGWNTAQQLRPIVHQKRVGAEVKFPRVEDSNVVEAFPNAYLGVCVSDDMYDRMPRLRRGEKFDWLFDCWVERGLIGPVVERIALEQLAALEGRFNRNRQHDERAALVCVLTAAGVYTGNYTAVGNEAGGYFFLPPWHSWATWAREELDRQRAREPGLEAWISGSRYLNEDSLPSSS